MDYATQVTEETLDQLARSVLHDPEFSAFRAWKGSAECILDVGANRGQSLASLRSIFPAATIHCFEANPVFFPVLDRMAMETSCCVHRFGLGANEEQVPFYVPWVGETPVLEEATTVRSYFDKPWVAQRFAERGGLRLEVMGVEIRRGDSLGLRPQIVKIDVEGAEHAVIVGLMETIRESHPILLVENSDYENVTPTLASLGYAPYRHQGDRYDGWLVPMSGHPTNSFYLRDEHLAGFGCRA